MTMEINNITVDPCLDLNCDKDHCGICNKHIDPVNSLYICESCKDLSIEDRIAVVLEIDNYLSPNEYVNKSDQNES